MSSDEEQASVPQGHLPVRVLILGGRDPYKNDLVKWMVTIFCYVLILVFFLMCFPGGT